MADCNSVTDCTSREVATIDGMKALYRDLLSPLQERIDSRELTCLPAMVGTCYEESPLKLMYVGRAVNGWESKWCPGTLDSLIDKVFAGEFKMASIATEPKQFGYNYNRSGFWQLCKEIMKQAGEASDWSDRIVWSNLYKVAPYAKGNPNNGLIEATIERCIDILNYELSLYRPAHVVFVTGDWWFDPSNRFKVSFADEFGILVKHNSDSVIIGRGCYQKPEGKIKIVVTQRPERRPGLTRDRHAREILSAFNSLA